MPRHVVGQLVAALSDRAGAEAHQRGGRILVIGIAYKKKCSIDHRGKPRR